MTGSTPLEIAMGLEMHLADAEGAAQRLAQAWRDLFNTYGAMPEVREAFERVERDVSDWED